MLANADLSGTVLSHSDLSGAVFHNTKLSGTDFTGGSLPDARPVTGLTQEQLDQACAEPDNPPKLEGVRDAETDEPLVWRGKPCDAMALNIPSSKPLTQYPAPLRIPPSSVTSGTPSVRASTTNSASYALRSHSSPTATPWPPSVQIAGAALRPPLPRRERAGVRVIPFFATDREE